MPTPSPLNPAWSVGYRDAYYHSANNSRDYLEDSARTLSSDQWEQYVDGYKKGASDLAATKLNTAWETVHAS
jgi:hypothetical protein